MNRWIAPVALLVALPVVCSCHGSSTPAPAPASPTTYQGSLSGSNNTTGTVSLTIAPAAALPGIVPLDATEDAVSGTITVSGGSPVSITGTFVPPNGPLSATGGGYTLSGGLHGTILNGPWTGPGGNGYFGLLPTSATDTVNVYCGTYVTTSGGSDSGLWDLVQSGTKLTGTYTNSAGASSAIYGDLIDGVMTITITSDGVTVIGTADGTINSPNVSGTWTIGTDPNTTSGTWSGSTTACGGSGAR